jgi:hypothetical protein
LGPLVSFLAAGTLGVWEYGKGRAELDGLFEFDAVPASDVDAVEIGFDMTSP